MSEVQVNDWVEVLQPNLIKYKSSSPVAHFGRVVKSNKKFSHVVIEIWGRPDSATNYFPLKFPNQQLIKVQ